MSIEDCLAEQRQKCTFNVQKMTEFLYPQYLLKDLKKSFVSNQTLQTDFNIFNKGRLQILKQTYKKIPLMINDKNYNKEANVIDALYLSIQQTPGSVHLGMFVKCIEIMGSEQQKKEFVQAGWMFEKIGCYAQTQIGHGSDVQSLQTVATFIQQTGQIQLHTPSVSASKFWPGQLGLMANYALVYAQLIMKGKKHGVHPFIVRIRDENWQCLPGITAGDIGPKLGFQAKQNGFLALDHIRIPRTNILGKYLQITKQGELKKLGNPLLGYVTMMFIRQFISTSVPKVYGQAISIAVRYGAFRKQFRNKSGQQNIIINYQTQIDKLIPRIAQYFAVTVGGNAIRKLCFENSLKAQKQDFSLIGETHACLCLGKAMYSEIVYDGMEICRKACGGHGYSHFSGFPNLINEFSPNLTHEGQNTVLYLQVARYIMNNYKKHMTQSGRLNQNAKYISSYDYFLQNRCPQHLASNSQSWRLEDIRILLAQVVCCLVEKVTGKLMNKNVENMSDVEFMGLFVGCNLQQLAKAHAVYFTFTHFLEALLRESNEQVRLVLISLCKLFGIGSFLQYASPVIEKGLISGSHISSLNECKQNLLNSLRPNAVGLIDSFFIPDSRLRSHLAKGNPYENYLQLARKCEINEKISQSAFIVKGIDKVLALHNNQTAKL